MASVELVVVSYPGEAKAQEVLKGLKQLQQQKELELINVAVLRKGLDGVPHVSETEDVDATRGAAFGAVVGGIVGLLGGPAGVVVGAAAGAAAGGLAAGTFDLGFSKDFLDELKTSLKPDTSAILALVEKPWVDPLVAVLSNREGKLLRHAVKDDLARQLSQAEPPEPPGD